MSPSGSCLWRVLRILAHPSPQSPRNDTWEPIDRFPMRRTVARDLMTPRSESTSPQAIPERLTAATPVTVFLGVPLAEAVSRLRRAVDSGATVDEASLTTDRRFTGEVSAGSVRLSVADSNWAHRRKGWKIEFLGRFESTPAPGALRGVVDIANRKSFRRRMLVLRIAALLPLPLGILSALGYLNGSDPPLFSALFGLSITIVGSWAAHFLVESIERFAADDARALMEYLRSRLA
jgi:hypothetical protein